MKHPDEFRFLDPEVQRCPYEYYSALRSHAPVYREPETGYYLVSRYADLIEVKKNPAVYSNDVMRAMSKRPPPEAREIYRQGLRRPATLHRTDPPAHARYRKLIGRTFTAARVREMAPYIGSVVDDLMRRFPGHGEVDFVADYAIPLPCLIIADQLGVPRADALRLKVWSDALLDPAGLMVSVEREIECAHLTLEFQRYFVARIEERRREPRNDILTDLCQRLDGEDPFSVEEVVNMIEQIMTGGNESTTSLLASGLLELIRHPEQQQLLRDEPAQVANFVEEVLRMESPVQSNFRVALEDTAIGGVHIPQGAVVVLRYGAANRDAARFDAAENFDPCRKDVAAHVAFGAGIHHCPGSLLARQEATATFAALLQRYERFELLQPEPLPYHPSFFLRGLRTLPVRLVPKAS